MPVEDAKIVFKKTGNALDITIPEELFRVDGLQIIKHFIQMDVFKFVTTIEKVNFVEIYQKQIKKEEPKPATEKPVAQKAA